MHSVLVIDDETDVRDGIQRVLERSGFSVRTVDNVTQAMSELKNTPTDVVITDIIMPRQSGMDAIGFIMREFPATRIVAISGACCWPLGTVADTRVATCTGCHAQGEIKELKSIRKEKKKR